VTGWGVTPGGVPYWVARNSWGTYWGERGWFKIYRGSNHLFIEEDCAWAVPDTHELERSLSKHKVGDYVSGAQRDPTDEADAPKVPRSAVVAAALAPAPVLLAEIEAVALEEPTAPAVVGGPATHTAGGGGLSNAAAQTASLAELEAVLVGTAALEERAAPAAVGAPATLTASGGGLSNAAAVAGALAVCAAAVAALVSASGSRRASARAAPLLGTYAAFGEQQRS